MLLLLCSFQDNVYCHFIPFSVRTLFLIKRKFNWNPEGIVSVNGYVGMLYVRTTSCSRVPADRGATQRSTVAISNRETSEIRGTVPRTEHNKLLHLHYISIYTRVQWTTWRRKQASRNKPWKNNGYPKIHAWPPEYPLVRTVCKLYRHLPRSDCICCHATYKKRTEIWLSISFLQAFFLQRSEELDTSQFHRPTELRSLVQHRRFHIRRSPGKKLRHRSSYKTLIDRYFPCRISADLFVVLYKTM